MMKQKSLTPILKSIFKIAISLILVYLILQKVNVNELGNVLLQVNFLWLILAFLLVLGGVLARTWRWHILLTDLKIAVSFFNLLQIYFIGFLFNNLLPTGLGGDAVRMIELNRYHHHPSDVVTSVLVDRFLGLLGALVLALVALVFRWNVVPLDIAIFSVFVFGSMVGVGFFLISQSFYHAVRKVTFIKKLTDVQFINNFFRSFQTYRLSTLKRSFLVSLLFNGLLIGTNVAVGLALGANINLAHYLIFVPIASLVLILPISFAGFGVREVTYITLFAQVGVSEEVSLSLSLLVYFLGNVIPGLIGGLIYLWRGVTN